MNGKLEDTESYESIVGSISRSVKKLVEQYTFRENCGIMHGLCEVVAVVARKNNLDFEEYVKCAICAWDCSLESQENQEKELKKGCSSWN